jgi:hypothetical protein
MAETPSGERPSVDLGDRTEMTCHVVGETGGEPAVAGWSSTFDKLAESLRAG